MKMGNKGGQQLFSRHRRGDGRGKQGFGGHAGKRKAIEHKTLDMLAMFKNQDPDPEVDFLPPEERSIRPTGRFTKRGQLLDEKEVKLVDAEEAQTREMWERRYIEEERRARRRDEAGFRQRERRQQELRRRIILWAAVAFVVIVAIIAITL